MKIIKRITLFCEFIKFLVIDIDRPEWDDVHELDEHTEKWYHL